MRAVVGGARQHERVITIFPWYKINRNLSRSISLSSLLGIRFSFQGTGWYVQSLILL